MLRPWRKVTGMPQTRTGRGSTLGPDTTRRTRWWELPLECGHTEQRTVRYRPHGDPKRSDDAWRRRRTAADILPAPTRVRCGQCPAEPA
jgi:hypothetical protein